MTEPLFKPGFLVLPDDESVACPTGVRLKTNQKEKLKYISQQSPGLKIADLIRESISIYIKEYEKTHGEIKLNGQP